MNQSPLAANPAKHVPGNRVALISALLGAILLVSMSFGVLMVPVLNGTLLRVTVAVSGITLVGVIGRRVVPYFIPSMAAIELYGLEQSGGGRPAVVPSGLTHDLTLEEERDEETGKFDPLISRSSDAVIIMDPTGKIKYASLGLNQVLKWRLDRAAGHQLLEFVNPYDRFAFQGALDVAMSKKGRSVTVEFRLLCENDDWRACEAVFTNLIEVPEVGSLVMNVRDISSRKRLEQDLKFESLHDRLTSLPNRALFAERLKEKIAAGEEFTILLLDIDDFKTINDSRGHDGGDLLLARVAERLSGFLGQNDSLARLSGDEFALLTDRVRSHAEVEEFATRMLAELTVPFALADDLIHLRFSMGICLSSAVGQKVDMARYSEIALHVAKSKGKNHFEFFQEGMDNEVIQRMEVENSLARALERNEFELYYQPIVHLADRKLYGFEALIRWNHPTKGLIMPGDFISVAERNGLILSIGDWVLNQAIHQVQEWQQQLPQAAGLSVSVNVSAQQLGLPNYVEETTRKLARANFGRGITLETTESVLIERLSVISQKFEVLRKAGYAMSLDDFGTGYSSLSYLNQLPLDIIKIDRSFVSNMTTDPTMLAFVRMILGLAQALNLRVVAEGIEEEEQAVALKEMGCQMGQGYLFARPMPLAAATNLIANGF